MSKRRVPRFTTGMLMLVMALVAVALGWWLDRRQLQTQVWRANRELIEVQHESAKLHTRLGQLQREFKERFEATPRLIDRSPWATYHEGEFDR